ncbi:uncharacterized protein PG998_013862 [Apiospora kogelbergensis]|uniref:uncharacterized protein n=1 Tax=Apiospora kogelbergensis TaxID=1337665 RepID=UPI00312EC086
MTPPCRTFTTAALESEIQTNDTGKKRKLDRGQKDIDLSQCALLIWIRVLIGNGLHGLGDEDESMMEIVIAAWAESLYSSAI